MKKLTIEGMHCDACQKLITMELEDAGFDTAISVFRQIGENIGELELADHVTDDEINKIKEIISKMDDYTIKE